MKRLAVLTAIVILAAAVPSTAQIRFGLLGGYALTPNANLSGGVAYGAGLTIEVAPNFSLELGALRFQASTTTAPDGLSQGTLGLVPIELGFSVRFPLATGFKLLLGAGGGYVLPHFSLDPQLVKDWEAAGFSIEEKVDPAFGFHIRGGFEAALNARIAMVVEARYSMCRSKGSWILSDRAGTGDLNGAIKNLNLDSLIFGVGLVFSFGR
jgi:opacity protein-like surface antigen